MTEDVILVGSVLNENANEDGISRTIATAAVCMKDLFRQVAPSFIVDNSRFCAIVVIVNVA